MTRFDVTLRSLLLRMRRQIRVAMLAVPECSSRLDQRQQGRPRNLRYALPFLLESDEHCVREGKACDRTDV
jgi:hypothetical protein